MLILIASLFSAICYCVPAAWAVSDQDVMVNEVELNPRGTDNGAEKVELYNPTKSTIDISGWTISSTGGGVADATLVISEGTILSPMGYHTVVGTNSQQWLDNADEVIELRNESGILIDSPGPFCDGDNDHRTWQRSADARKIWIFSSNTLDGANSLSSASEFELPSQLASGHPIIIESEPSILENSTTVEAVTRAIQPNQNLTISFIDVGQGDSILIILPNTRTLLIDGGEREASDKVLATLQEYGLSHIDVVVATHPHTDHYGGLIDVIRNVEVGQVLGSQMDTNRFFDCFLDAIETKQIPLKSVREGDSINLDPTVKIDVLNPPTNVPDIVKGITGVNDNSIVLKLTYGQFSALLAGDIEEGNEARLVSKNLTALDVDVLKAGHHGGRTSSTSPFLNAVTPEAVIISLGTGNSFGYPHYEALERISAAGTERLFRTDLDGTITLSVNGCSEYYSIVTENNEKYIVIDDLAAAKLEMVCSYYLQ